MNTIEKAQAAKVASFRLATIPEERKNQAIERVAKLLVEKTAAILAANQKDVDAAQKEQISPVLLKRLVLNEKKIGEMVESLEGVVKLADPVGAVSLARELDEGLVLEKVSVPIGVIGIIFESRPDALVQISSLCIKSGNAAILKGGSEAVHTNRALFALFEQSLEETDAQFSGCLQLVESREDIRELLALDEHINLMIPRGSNALVKNIQENTKIPVMGHADGICHVYIDAEMDLETALKVTIDSKTQYAAVCNALETLIVHESVAASFLPSLKERMVDVALRGDEKTRAIISVDAATETDWRTEYTDMILSVKVVDTLDAAIEHINTFGSHHTDCIVTTSAANADRFMNAVDSSTVMKNCSTRFADGFRYGFGAEVGISTHKIHARGPVGLDGLVTYKYRVVGDGHVVADYAAGDKSFTHRDLSEGTASK